jgi:hypothetical protein
LENQIHGFYPSPHDIFVNFNTESKFNAGFCGSGTLMTGVFSAHAGLLLGYFWLENIHSKIGEKGKRKCGKLEIK